MDEHEINYSSRARALAFILNIPVLALIIYLLFIAGSDDTITTILYVILVVDGVGSYVVIRKCLMNRGEGTLCKIIIKVHDMIWGDQ